jgi:hypothetical protein
MSTRMVRPCQAHEFTINAMHTVTFFHQYGKAATLSDHGEDVAQAMHGHGHGQFMDGTCALLHTRCNHTSCHLLLHAVVGKT